jgi:ATP synthase F1 gamma subunit
MSVLGEQREKLEDFKTAKFITGALRDISANRLHTIRDEYERNQTFYRDLSELYNILKAYAVQKRAELLQTDEKTRVNVAITSNKRFFGTLNTEVMETFVQETNPDERSIIIGETGQQFLREQNYEKRRRSEYMIFENDQPSREDMLYFLTRTHAFNEVLVFYPRFESVFNQSTAKQDITYTPPIEEAQKRKVDYIFEPELEKMLEFFETQVRYLLFNRIMMETELARASARVMKMNSAEQRASDLIDEQQRTLEKEIASLSTKRMLETFAGFTKWKQ